MTGWTYRPGAGAGATLTDASGGTSMQSRGRRRGQAMEQPRQDGQSRTSASRVGEVVETVFNDVDGYRVTGLPYHYATCDDAQRGADALFQKRSAERIGEIPRSEGQVYS